MLGSFCGRPSLYEGSYCFGSILGAPDFWNFKHLLCAVAQMSCRLILSAWHSPCSGDHFGTFEGLPVQRRALNFETKCALSIGAPQVAGYVLSKNDDSNTHRSNI